MVDNELTRRQALIDILGRNMGKIDRDLRPIIDEVDTLPVKDRMMINGILTAITKLAPLFVRFPDGYEFDIRHNPSMMFIVFLSIIPPQILDVIWDDYKPIFQWIDSHVQPSTLSGSTPLDTGPNGQRENDPITGTT